jgi:hypothetical protein
MPVDIHSLEHLFGIAPAMWSSQEFVLGDLSIFVCVQGIETFLAAQPRRTLGALTLTAVLGKRNTCNDEHRNQTNYNSRFQMSHGFLLPTLIVLAGQIPNIRQFSFNST